MTKSTVTKLVATGLIAMIVGLLSIGLFVTFMGRSGRPGGAGEDTDEPGVADGAA
jgi:hypothetical protein